MERYDLMGIPNASSEEAGVLRVAAETDEKNCGCNDAAITPNNLYSLLDYRKASTAYTAGAIVACPYHKEFLLKCTTGGTTSANSIDTKSVTKGGTITDGGVVWTVIASQIIDVAISRTVITVTFIDGTQKTLTTQDTDTNNITAYSSSDSAWYVQFNNGFCIQGGVYTAPETGYKNVVVTFAKEFKNNKYTALMMHQRTSGTADGAAVGSKTTTGCTFYDVYCENADKVKAWIATGWVA